MLILPDFENPAGQCFAPRQIIAGFPLWKNMCITSFGWKIAFAYLWRLKIQK
jgi:hypothetical protein